MRGPKPKPTHLKIIAGNPGKRPINKREPNPIGNLKQAPNWMNDSQQKIWQIGIKNAPAGLLKELDESIFVTWVVAKDFHKDATQMIAELGMMVTTPNTGEQVQNPYMAVVNKQAQIMMKAAAEMGFTPSSRTRVVIDDGNNRGDEWDGF